MYRDESEAVSNKLILQVGAILSGTSGENSEGDMGTGRCLRELDFDAVKW